jgi:uncharacterized protein YjiS (DUF1127 family)
MTLPGFLAALVAKLTSYRRPRRTERRISEMTDRDLEDLGLFRQATPSRDGGIDRYDHV